MSIESDEQLKRWVDGDPVHDSVNDVCCPDFACCNKAVKTDRETRERFAKAHNEGDETTEMEMLMMFLGNAFQSEGKDIYVAGSSISSTVN